MQSGMQPYPSTAYILALIGGILILIGSILEAIVLAILGSIVAGLGFGFAGGLVIALAVVALLFGILILIFALRLKSQPQNARMTGIIILILSLISFVGGGGFYIGGILALIGGILAIVWTPPMMMGQPMMGQPMMGQPMMGQPMAPPPPAQPPQAAPFCATCGRPTTYVAQYGRYYCDNCKKYV